MTLHPDHQVIEKLGGSTVLAARLWPDKPFGVQRVQNWRWRGIPALVRLEHPDVFPRDIFGQAPSKPAAKRIAARKGDAAKPKRRVA